MANPISQSTKESPALSFPRDIFAALQPRQYLLAHLSPPSKSQTPIRPNGRKPTEFRKPNINTNSLTHCNGSAVVRLGDTSVVCGVRGEILLARDIPNPPPAPSQNTTGNEEEEEEDDTETLATLGLLVPNIELSTGSNPSHLPGLAPSSFAQALTSRLLQLLSTTHLVPLRDLRIWHTPPSSEGQEASPPEIKAYWTLYLDVLFISLDGGAFDAAWLAVLSALRSTTLPNAWWDADLENILCSDALDAARPLALRGFPVAASVGVFASAPVEKEDEEEGETWLLADLDQFEEEHCAENVCVVVDLSGEEGETLRAVDKRGGGAVNRELVKTAVGWAEGRWRECWEVVSGQAG